MLGRLLGYLATPLPVVEIQVPLRIFVRRDKGLKLGQVRLEQNPASVRRAYRQADVGATLAVIQVVYVDQRSVRVRDHHVQVSEDAVDDGQTEERCIRVYTRAARLFWSEVWFVSVVVIVVRVGGILDGVREMSVDQGHQVLFAETPSVFELGRLDAGGRGREKVSGELGGFKGLLGKNEGAILCLPTR